MIRLPTETIFWVNTLELKHEVKKYVDIADVRRERGTTQHDGHTEASEAVRPQRREAVG